MVRQPHYDKRRLIMSDSLYYNQFGAPAETLGLEKVIDRLRGMDSRTLNTTMGLALGLMQGITIQENRWAGDEARESWKVKYQATVEAYIKLVSKWLPVNATLVNHVAKEVYVLRNNLTPNNILNFLWFNNNINTKMTQQRCLKDNVIAGELAEKSQENNIDFNWMESHASTISRIYGHLEEILWKLPASSFGTKEIEGSNTEYYNVIAQELSTLMEDGEVSAFIDVDGCRGLLLECINITRSFISDYIPVDDKQLFYIVHVMLPELLPANFTLDDLTKTKIGNVLKGMPEWKMD